MGDVYLGAGRVAKSPRKQQGFHLFTDRWISGLFVGRSELKQLPPNQCPNRSCISGLFVGRSELKLSGPVDGARRNDLRSIRRPERIETLASA